jgi:putative ABC transport system permease protein
VSLWRHVTRGIRTLVHRRASDRELADEVGHYLEQATAANIARGMEPDAARRAASIAIGNATYTAEEARSYGWENLVETALADLRFAARKLRADPAFTIVALLTLSLGVGGTTAIFSAVNPILFQPLPYPQPERVVSIWEMRTDGARADGSFGMYSALAQRSRTVEHLAIYKAWQPTMTGTGEPQRFDGQRVTPEYFRALGIPPTAGRGLDSTDDRAGAPNVVLLSDGLWRRQFGADRSVVGRQITLDGDAYTVIGVMPASFENVVAPEASVWTTLRYDLSQGRAWGHHLHAIARLRPGVSSQAAERELDALAPAVIAEQHPPTYGDRISFGVASLHDDVIRGVKPALLAILGAMLLVLAIACVNVTNLLLARGVHRTPEFALRAALGAPRSRLVGQLLTESLLLALLGGVLGLVIARAGVTALVALSPTTLPRSSAIHVDPATFAFCFVIAAACAVSCALWPAARAGRSDPNRALQHDTRRSVGGHRRVRGMLVISEVALALVLLISSGLLLRSLQRLFAVDTGFDASAVLTMQVQTSGHRFDNDTVTQQYWSDVLNAVRGVAGVQSAAFTSSLPLSGDAPDTYGAFFESRPPEKGEDPSAQRYAVSGPYIETMGIQLVRGRSLRDADRAGTPRVALINEAYARRLFPSQDALGQRLRMGPVQEPVTVVGIVRDVRQQSLALSQTDAVYLPESQWPFVDRSMSLVVRAKPGLDAASLASSVRSAVWSVDKDQPVIRVATMQALVDASASERRFSLLLFEAFTLAALVLAAAGIYGVLAGSVAERTREIGVRAALGASRGRIVGRVLAEGGRLLLVGVVLGLVAAAGATRFIASLLFGVTRFDVMTYVGVLLTLGVVALVASAVPALRAARLDPATTLRAE